MERNAHESRLASGLFLLSRQILARLIFADQRSITPLASPVATLF